MNISIADFIDEYIEGEPLTNDTIAYAIKKYMYINCEPTKQEKLDMYETLLWDIAGSIEHNSDNTSKLLTNIRNWAYARVEDGEGLSENETKAVKNETFYNLCKLK